MENKKYDLEKAKEDCQRHKDALEEAQSCMCGHCHECGFDPAEMKAALDEIDQQAKQIESLKEKLVEERARRICHVPTDSVGHWSRYEDIVVAEARQQLAQEMPEVDWQ